MEGGSGYPRLVMNIINLGQGMAVERVIELVTHRTIYIEISLQLYFLKENCQRLMNVLTSLKPMTLLWHVRCLTRWKIYVYICW